MWKLAATGAALLAAGAVQFAAYLNRAPTLEDYLAFRCGPSEQARLIGSTGHTLASLGHCWGCFAMAIGAGLVLLALFIGLARNRRPAWHVS